MGGIFSKREILILDEDRKSKITKPLPSVPQIPSKPLPSVPQGSLPTVKEEERKAKFKSVREYWEQKQQKSGGDFWPPTLQDLLFFPKLYWPAVLVVIIIILLIMVGVYYLYKYLTDNEGLSVGEDLYTPERSVVEDWQRQYYRKLYHQPWYMFAQSSPIGRVSGLESIIQRNEDYFQQPYDLYNPSLGGPSMVFPFPFPRLLGKVNKRERGNKGKEEGFGDYISGANLVLTPAQIKYLKSKGMTDAQIISLIMKGTG